MGGLPQTPSLLLSISLLALHLPLAGNRFKMQEDLKGWSWTQGGEKGWWTLPLLPNC